MSSKRRIRRKSCTGKVGYSNAADAQKVIRHLKKDGWWMNVYRCKFCAKYHTGHAPHNRKVQL